MKEVRNLHQLPRERKSERSLFDIRNTKKDSLAIYTAQPHRGLGAIFFPHFTPHASHNATLDVGRHERPRDESGGYRDRSRPEVAFREVAREAKSLYPIALFTHENLQF